MSVREGTSDVLTEVTVRVVVGAIWPLPDIHCVMVNVDTSLTVM